METTGRPQKLPLDPSSSCLCVVLSALVLRCSTATRFELGTNAIDWPATGLGNLRCDTHSSLSIVHRHAISCSNAAQECCIRPLRACLSIKFLHFFGFTHSKMRSAQFSAILSIKLLPEPAIPSGPVLDNLHERIPFLPQSLRDCGMLERASGIRNTRHHYGGRAVRSCKERLVDRSDVDGAPCKIADQAIVEFGLSQSRQIPGIAIF